MELSLRQANSIFIGLFASPARFSLFINSFVYKSCCVTLKSKKNRTVNVDETTHRRHSMRSVFIPLRLHYHLTDSCLWVSRLCQQNDVRLETIIKQRQQHNRFVCERVHCALAGGLCVFFERQQQPFSLRRQELNQRGAAAVVAEAAPTPGSGAPAALWYGI